MTTLVSVAPTITTSHHDTTRPKSIAPSTTATVVSTIPSSPPSNKRTMVTLPSTPTSASKKTKKTTKTSSHKSPTPMPANTAVRLSTGRWTAEEHALFLEGLDSYGKGWKQIASLIKTRTVVQIRTHAQKYFQKLAKNQERQQQQEVNNNKAAASGSKRRRNPSKKTGLFEAKPAIAAVPQPPPPSHQQQQHVPSYNDTTLSGTALEDSLFRFDTAPPTTETQAPPTGTTPAWTAPSLNAAPPAKDVPSWYTTSSTPPPNSDGVQVNEVARQAGVANPIVLPDPNPSALGAGSPTAVTDIWAAPPTSSDPKEAPTWCNSKQHIDAIDNLLEADALDWLLDPTTGELPPATAEPGNETSFHGLPKAPVLGTGLPPPPPVAVVTPSPTMTELNAPVPKRQKIITSTPAPIVTVVDDHLNLFDSAMEEQDFVATILDENHNCDEILPPIA
eukprot:CAMPEP_0202442660 /NCGR_PEP_ID=MMETSP1360-20130828/2047_1 /ASSEMBLY_ACC=CAM_ASM_000848 /TAXON_ID=515479 /ORGANISM="Licmophora paradoxa, Strain CCMP2313" /LENGTH=446 /DNA_ID=CAMNT_0049058085 /DNA_START=81 /DNA_END=1421 /DNA_ORIENTATION=+